MIIHTLQATLNSGASLVIHREENELHVKIEDKLGSIEQRIDDVDSTGYKTYLALFEDEVERSQAISFWILMVF